MEEILHPWRRGLAVLLLLLLGACAPVEVPSPAPDGAPKGLFQLPLRLETEDGSPIDVGDVGGYACPTVVKFPGKEAFDLVVGAFDGKFRHFANTGDRLRPRFARPAFLHAGGEIASVPMG